MHLFWLALIVPAVILSQWIWPVLRRRSIWSLGAIMIGTLIIAWLAMGLPTLENSDRTFNGVMRMFAFRLVASTDLPLVQLLAACAVGWFRSKKEPASLNQMSTLDPDADPESELPAEQPVLG